MDFDIDDKTSVALAEYLGIDVDIVEMLNLELEENNGHSKDEWHYGYYVEFPELEEIDKPTRKRIFEILSANIPWGETIYLDDGDLGNTNADPFGWRAEWEEEYYYQTHSLSKENTLDELSSIQKKISSEMADELITKSLIFSMFSVVESFVRSFVWSKIPSVENKSHEVKLKIIQENSRGKSRNKLYNGYTGKTLKEIPYFKEIRNSLAHNLISAKIIGNEIVITNLYEKVIYTDISNIVKDLINYIKELE